MNIGKTSPKYILEGKRVLEENTEEMEGVCASLDFSCTVSYTQIIQQF